ncbi:MAG: ATP-binding protein [Patescibacteria group bacterium]|nr:ATP-binding protein [Patescibacteria group bacterium]
MANSFEFRPAQRTNAKPLIGLYSESGCGKTYSALLLARGFVGQNGKIGMIETESGRGEAYADPKEYPEIGGYQVLPLHGDFSPSTYGKAIEAAEKEKFDALIIDSASHEWEGAGGVLSMAAANEAGGSKGQLIWQKPKIEHQRQFMLRFMQSSIPLVILCMRAKYPMVQVTGQGGKKEWVRSTTLEPKQSDDILFEMFVHGWIDTDHKFHRTKSTAKALEPVFLDNEAITSETGRKLSAWAQGGGSDSRESDLLARAQNEAEKGILALRQFWKGLAQEDYNLLKSQARRLKALADRADADDIDPILAPTDAPQSDSIPATVDAAPEKSEPLARGLDLLARQDDLQDINDLSETIRSELTDASEIAMWENAVADRAEALKEKI